MKIIVGLGNYKSQYLKNRHNAGFMFADLLALRSQDSTKFSGEKKFQALVKEIKLSDLLNQISPGTADFCMKSNTDIDNQEKILIVKPLTYMNKSGDAVGRVLSYYKIKPQEDLILVYDDLDLKLGSTKIHKGKSPRGHNGVLSVINAVGTEDFTHVRIGIDNRNGKLVNENLLDKPSALQEKGLNKGSVVVQSKGQGELQVVGQVRELAERQTKGQIAKQSKELPQHRISGEDYVLQDFTREEMQIVNKVLENLLPEILKIICNS